MNNLFRIDSKFYNFMTKVADCMLLSCLWLLFSFPVVTAGAATAALYFSVVRVVREGEGTVWKSFWGSFRANLRQASIVSIPALLACSFWVQVVEAMAVQGQTREPLYPVALILLGAAVMWLHYLISYLARFRDTLRATLRNTFLICLGHFPSSLLMLALFVCVIVMLYSSQPINPLVLLFVPSLYALAVSLVLEPIYRKYAVTPPEEEHNHEL